MMMRWLLILLLIPTLCFGEVIVDTLDGNDGILGGLGGGNLFWDCSMFIDAECGDTFDVDCGDPCTNYNLGGEDTLIVGTRTTGTCPICLRGHFSAYIGFNLSSVQERTRELTDSVVFEGYVYAEQDTSVNPWLALYQLKQEITTYWPYSSGILEFRDGSDVGCYDELPHNIYTPDSSMTWPCVSQDSGATSCRTAWGAYGGFQADVDFYSTVYDSVQITDTGWFHMRIDTLFWACMDSGLVDLYDDTVYVADCLLKVKGHQCDAPQCASAAYTGTVDKSQKFLYSAESGTNPPRILVYSHTEDETTGPVDDLHGIEGAGVIHSIDGASQIHKP